MSATPDPTDTATSSPPEKQSFSERLRIRAGDTALWFAIMVIPARLVAWLIHQRCLWRRRIRRQRARAAS